MAGAPSAVSPILCDSLLLPSGQSASGKSPHCGSGTCSWCTGSSHPRSSVASETRMHLAPTAVFLCLSISPSRQAITAQGAVVLEALQVSPNAAVGRRERLEAGRALGYGNTVILRFHWMSSLELGTYRVILLPLLSCFCQNGRAAPGYRARTAGSDRRRSPAPWRSCLPTVPLRLPRTRLPGPAQALRHCRAHSARQPTIPARDMAAPRTPGTAPAVLGGGARCGKREGRLTAPGGGRGRTQLER